MGKEKGWLFFPASDLGGGRRRGLVGDLALWPGLVVVCFAFAAVRCGAVRPKGRAARLDTREGSPGASRGGRLGCVGHGLASRFFATATGLHGSDFTVTIPFGMEFNLLLQIHKHNSKVKIKYVTEAENEGLNYPITHTLNPCANLQSIFCVDVGICFTWFFHSRG